jgi:ankyrin repeat protein
MATASFGGIHWVLRCFVDCYFVACEDTEMKDACDLPELHLAVALNDFTRAEDLLKAGADINAASRDGDSALHWMCYLGNHQAVRFLAEHGACLDIRDGGGRMAVHIAAERHTSHCIQVLIQFGADPNARDNDGRAPVHYAAIVGSLKCLKFLSKHGAEMCPPTGKSGPTPLTYSTTFGPTAVFIFLKSVDGSGS